MTRADTYDVLREDGDVYRWEDVAKIAREHPGPTRSYPPVEFDEARGLPWVIVGPFTEWLRRYGVSYELRATP